MSIRVMSYVWEHSRQTEGALLVLLAIADFADDEGVAYPGVPRLARKARLSERQVQRVVRKLVDEGELAVAENAGPGRRNRYTVTQNGDKTSPRQNVTGDAHVTRNGDASVTTEPSLEPSVKDAAVAVKPQGSTRARARGDGGFHPLATFLTTGPAPAAATATRSTFDLPDEVRERLARPPISAHR